MAITIASPAPPVLQSDTFEIQRQKINNTAAAFTSLSSAVSSAPTCIWIGYFASGEVSPGASLTITKEFGSITVSGIRTDSRSGNYTITHNLNSTNYFVTALGYYRNDAPHRRPNEIQKSANSFIITTSDDNTGNPVGLYMQIWTYTP